MQISSQAGQNSAAESISVEERLKYQNLIQQLKTDDLDLLNETVQALTRQANQAFPLMLEALLSPDEEIRKNIAWVLGFLQKPESIKPLFHVLSTDSNMDVRLSASWALRQMNSKLLAAFLFTKLEPPQNFEDIKAYLSSKSWKARWYCTAFLTLHPNADCLDALLEVARGDENVVVRCSAILSLSAYQQEEIPEVLCQLLHDINDYVKIEAASVLSLKNQRNAVPELVKQLQAYNENVRVSVISALGALGDLNTVPHLATALKDPVDLVRINAAIALFDIAQRIKRPHNTIRDLCLKALRDKNLYVVKNAARTLGLVGDEEALRQIISLIKQETRPEILSNLVQALGLFKDKRSVNVLSKLLRHSSWEVRFEVVRALGLVKNAEKELYPLLLQSIKDPSMMVKEQAIHALGRLGNRKAIPHLEKMKLQHPYGKVNKTINKALDRLLGI